MEIAPLIIAGLMTLIFAKVVYLVARRSARKLNLRAKNEAQPADEETRVERTAAPARSVSDLDPYVFTSPKLARRSHSAMVNAIRARAAGKIAGRSGHTGHYRAAKIGGESKIVIIADEPTAKTFFPNL